MKELDRNMEDITIDIDVPVYDEDVEEKKTYDEDDEVDVPAIYWIFLAILASVAGVFLCFAIKYMEARNQPIKVIDERECLQYKQVYAYEDGNFTFLYEGEENPAYIPSETIVIEEQN